MDLKEFGLLWQGKPISKKNRQEFIDSYYELLGPTDKKAIQSAIFNELSRFFFVKKTQITTLTARKYTDLVIGENYYMIGELKENEE